MLKINQNRMRSKRLRRLTPTVATVIVLTVAVFSCASESAETVTNDDGFKQIESIDMLFKWRVQGDTLEMKVTAPGTGWIAVGFDAETIMKGADYIIGYVADGEGVIQDNYGHTEFGHKLDIELGGTDNVTLITVSESAEAGTMMHFSIPLDSGDQYDKKLVPGQKHRGQLAYHQLNDDFVSRHSNRIEIEVEL